MDLNSCFSDVICCVVCCDGDRLVIVLSSIRRFVIKEKAPTRAFSWLKAATTDFTFKILC